MKLLRIPFIAILLLAFCGGVKSQEVAEPVLVDEFGRISCEDLLARADNLGSQLKNRPGVSALVVIYGAGDNESRANYFANFVHRALISRWDPESKVTVVRVGSQNTLKGRFWMVPQGANVELPTHRVVGQIPFRINSRVRFSVVTGDPCTNHIGKGFANTLKSDESLLGIVVDFNVPPSRRMTSAAEWVEYFKTEHNIPRERLRIFFKRDPKLSEHFSGYTEFWLAPANKK